MKNSVSMSKSDIYVVHNFCDCRLCRGSKLANNPSKKQLDKWIKDGSYAIIETGGRKPTAIFYPVKIVKPVWISANGNYEIDTNHLVSIDRGFIFNASVHGCHKIKCNQQIEIMGYADAWEIIPYITIITIE